jgi:hypothetical protein
MKINKSIAVIGAVACLSTASVSADDVRSVVKIDKSAANPVSINNVSVNPKVTIRDYVNAAIKAENVTSNSVTNVHSLKDIREVL